MQPGAELSKLAALAELEDHLRRLQTVQPAISQPAGFESSTTSVLHLARLQAAQAALRLDATLLATL